MSNILLDKEILLESGTNELEVLVFDVADFTFGINVAKVREVLPTSQITSLPRAHSSIRGVFKLRNNVIPCVSLLDHLASRSAERRVLTRYGVSFVMYFMLLFGYVTGSGLSTLEPPGGKLGGDHSVLGLDALADVA